MYKKNLIPVWDVYVHTFTQCVDVYKTRNSKLANKWFGPGPKHDDYIALVSSNHNHFGLFLPKKPQQKTVGHELFHLTMRITQWVGSEVQPYNHEHAALLCGYLHEVVRPLL